ncbi:MAG: C-terminal binding protein [Verrucomicrobia bacterium]|nr:C-terminal binding protein [Verrucomicrobiota bacterium]
MNTQRFKIIVTDFIADALEPEKKALGDIADVTALNAHHEDDLRGRVEDADALMVYHHLSVTRKTIEQLTRCKLINRCGVGFDNVDWRFARERGIAVTNVPDYGTEDVADTAIGMMLALTRGTHFLNSRLRAGLGPWLYTQAAPIRRLRGRVFGIVGLGRIGTAVALRAKAFGMDVVFYDPYVPDGRDKSVGVRRALEFDDLLRQSHVLSLHCPLTDETRGMINAAAIAKLPRGAYLVNTARGAIVDTAAIPGAIASGQLAGAGIDVLRAEPPPDTDPLVAAWRDPNHSAHHRVIINPHSAFYCEEGLLEIRVKSSDACRRALLGQPLRNVVN